MEKIKSIELMSLRANKSFSHSVLVFVVVLLSPSSSCISICIIFQYAHQRIIHLFNFETVLVLCHHWHSLGILSVCRNCWCLSHFSFFPSFSSFSLPLALALVLFRYTFLPVNFAILFSCPCNLNIPRTNFAERFFFCLPFISTPRML